MPSTFRKFCTLRRPVRKMRIYNDKKYNVTKHWFDNIPGTLRTDFMMRINFTIQYINYKHSWKLFVIKTITNKRRSIFRPLVFL